MLNYIASQGVIYFAYNTKISVCKYNHAFYGEICPQCGESKADTYTRVVGFLTPVSKWPAERQEEFTDRKFWPIRTTLGDTIIGQPSSDTNI